MKTYVGVGLESQIFFTSPTVLIAVAEFKNRMTGNINMKMIYIREIHHSLTACSDSHINLEGECKLWVVFGYVSLYSSYVDVSDSFYLRGSIQELKGSKELISVMELLSHSLVLQLNEKYAFEFQNAFLSS
jgi:hypothetical protein